VSPAPSAHPGVDAHVYAEQVRALYSSTWAGRYSPFAALLVLLVLNWTRVPEASAILVILCHVVATITLELARASYANDPDGRPIEEWARISTGISALAGTTWVLATVVWFDRGDYVSQALLSLIILAVGTASMIARFTYLPAFGIHLVLSMAPLISLLAVEGAAIPTFTASLGFIYALLLYSWAVKFNRSSAETIRLRFTKAQLINELRAAKEAAETARIVAEEGRAAAEAGARAKSEFLATVSHEIRTPLNSILGMSEFLCQSELPQIQHDAAESIRNAGGGLKVIVDDIIDLSRLEAGKLGVERSACDVRRLVETVVGALEGRASEKSLELCAHVDSSVPSHIESDVRCLRQILINLTGNAIKFTETGTIRILVTVSDEVLRCSVRDTGVGIAPDKLDRLFAPFSQVDQSYSRQHGGTGLGLAICQRLVQSIGGSIRVESEAGCGSTFSFQIPLVRSSFATEGKDFSIVRRAQDRMGMPALEGDDANLVDTAQIARLGLSLGEATLLDVLGSYLDIEATILADLEKAALEGDTVGAARASQNLASASADLGLLKLSTASRALAQMARDMTSPQNFAAEAESLRDEAKRTQQTLLRLFPDLRARA
jgi:signal transduction histidine kinase